MAEYYCLMAGAPDLSLEQRPAPISPQQFREQWQEVADARDRGVLAYLFLRQDCLNMAVLLEQPDAEPHALGCYSTAQLRELIREAQTVNENTPPFPPILYELARQYPLRAQQPDYHPKDHALSLYYQYAIAHCPNGVMKAWFELNLNITNILTALIAKSMGWNPANYIQGGENELSEQLLTSTAKDFALPPLYDYAAQVLRIAEETDPTRKEQLIDALRWQWLDDNALSDEFAIEAVFAYLCKLDMLQRWELLDPQQGKETFTRLIEQLRQGAQVPAEFRPAGARARR